MFVHVSPLNLSEPLQFNNMIVGVHVFLCSTAPQGINDIVHVITCDRNSRIATLKIIALSDLIFL